MSLTDEKMPYKLGKVKSASSTANSSRKPDPERLSLSVGQCNELVEDNARVKKHFGPFSILALGFNICNSWVAVAASISIVIAAGGPVTLVYGTILASFVYAVIGACLAELSSVYPSAGGQYHFTSILAPKRFSRGLSYSCGAISTFSWIAISASITILAAQMVLSIPVYYVEGYTPPSWHYFLVFQAINLILLLYNLFALKATPWVHDIGFILTLATFVVVTIACLALSDKQPSVYVWATFQNGTGWSSGVTFLTGFVTPCFMFSGVDATMHMAEECTEPEKTVPRAIMATVATGFVTGLVFSIAMCYGIQDLDALLNTTMPIYELWRQATGSSVAATTFIVALIVISFFAVNAVQQTASHLIWAFGRDNGLIFSRQLATMHPSLEVPVWSLLANAFVIFICGCIYLASTAAFNALVNTALILQIVSFAMPCALLIYRRRSEEFLPKDRWFRLPNALGYILNSLVIIFAIIELVFFDFPTVLPATGSNMNYTCAVLAIMALFSAINWFLHARKQYEGPRMELTLHMTTAPEPFEA